MLVRAVVLVRDAWICWLQANQTTAGKNPTDPDHDLVHVVTQQRVWPLWLRSTSSTYRSRWQGHVAAGREAQKQAR